MKKETKTILIIAALMLVLGSALVRYSLARGAKLNDLFNGDLSFSFGSGAISFGADQKDFTVCESGEDSFDAAEVKNLDLDWISGAVNVERYDGRSVVIREQAKKALSENQRMRWKLKDGTLSVLFCANNESNVPDKTLTVLLPRELRLRDVDVETISASVSLSEVRATGEVEIDTSSGAVRCNDSVCASLDLDSISGEILLDGMEVNGDVDADTTSGKIVMRRLSADGDADIDTVSGAVELRFEKKPASVDVDTTSGAVTLAFPKDTLIDLDYDTATGQLRGTLNSGAKGLPVDVSTISGDLTLD